MTGIGCYWLESLLFTQKITLSHQSQNALAVNLKAAVLEFCSHPPVTVASEFHSYLLNLVLQIHILRVSGGYFRLYPPFVVAAATYITSSAWQDWDMDNARPSERTS